MKDHHRAIKKRAVSLCAAIAVLSVILSGCGNGSMGNENTSCVPRLASEIESGGTGGGSDESVHAQADDGGVSKLKALRPVLQNPTYPNGCEIASLATVLRYNGFDAALEELSETYLPRQDFTLSKQGVLTGSDPEEYYVGDPASEQGWYCFEQPVAEAADTYLSDQGSDLRACIMTGAELEELKSSLDDGIPVIVWFTVDYDTPVYSSDFQWTLDTGKKYIPYHNLHCLVLTAIEGNTCRLADPLAGVTRVDTGTFEEIYTRMGQRALAIVSAEEA